MDIKKGSGKSKDSKGVGKGKGKAVPFQGNAKDMIKSSDIESLMAAKRGRLSSQAGNNGIC